MKKHEEFVPMNSNERLLYAIVTRQEVIIEQLSSIIEHIAKKDEVSVTNAKVEAVDEKTTVEEPVEKPKPKRRKSVTKAGE